MSENTNTVSSLINKIILDLKSDSLRPKFAVNEWKRLSKIIDDNSNLSNPFLNEYVSYNAEKNELIVLESFCKAFKNGYIFIFALDKPHNKKTFNYILAIQSNRDSKIVELNDINNIDIQAELIRAANLIERKIDNVDNFIKEFMDN